MKKMRKPNSRTLLGRFIHEKTRQYVEPSREGTPRGEPIGFSGVKYGATLYSLTKTKQKEVAERLGISHGLLRKWNTEEPFKALVEKHCLEFAEVFIENIRDRIRRREELQDAFNSQSFQKVASQELPSLDYDEILDAHLYSNKLSQCICDAAATEVERANQQNNIILTVEISFMLSAVAELIGDGKMSALVASEEKRVKNLVANSLIEDGIEILLKPNLDEDDKKSLLNIFKILAWGFR